MYATIPDLEDSHGQEFLDNWLGGIPEDRRPTTLTQLLQAATARINSALVKGQYPAPITSADVEPGFADEVMSALRYHCCNLAAWQLIAGSNDLPTGPKEAAKFSETWLADISAGKLDIVGIDRLPAEIAGRNQGAVIFVPDGEGDNFPRNFHRRTSMFG